jgi:hypothetical protein
LCSSGSQASESNQTAKGKLRTAAVQSDPADGEDRSIGSLAKRSRHVRRGKMSSAASWEGPTAAELKAASAEAIPGGVRVKGWVIQSHKGPILNAASVQRYELPPLNPSVYSVPIFHSWFKLVQDI